MPNSDQIIRYLAILIGLYVIVVYFEGFSKVLEVAGNTGIGAIQTLQGVNAKTGVQRAYPVRM